MRILRLTICVIILTVGLAITPALGASHYTVRSSGISLDLSRDGRIVGAVLGNNKIKWNALGETHSRVVVSTVRWRAIKRKMARCDSKSDCCVTWVERREKFI